MSVYFSYCRYCNYPTDGDSEYLCDPTDLNACEPCKRLSEIDAKVKEIRMMLIDIEGKRWKLKTEVNQHHDKLSRRLPPEIVGKIFESCIPGNLFDLGYYSRPSRSTFCSPLIISAVSTKWRDLSYSTPHLWNILPLYSGPPYSLPAPFIVSKWIERAGQLPLFIFLDVPSHTTYDEPVFQMIDALNQASTRWKKLWFCGNSMTFSHFSNEGLPELQSIFFMNTINYNINGNIKIKMLPKRLTTLSIHGISQLPSIDFSWEHLTRLDLNTIPFSSLFEALRKAPYLKTFIVSLNCKENEDIDKLLPSFIHPRLQELDIRPNHNIQCFENIRCPCLESFTLRTSTTSFEDSMLEIPHALTFLQQSNCSLKHLSIIGGGCPSVSDIISICERNPTLKYLQLRIHNLEDSKKMWKSLFAYLSEFTIIDGCEIPRYLPNLHSLELYLYTLSNWNQLPDIFGYPAGHPPVNHRPMLGTVTISTFIEGNIIISPDNINEESLGRILWLEKAGVRWKCQNVDSFGTIDLIRYAAEYHKVRQEGKRE